MSNQGNNSSLFYISFHQQSHRIDTPTSFISSSSHQPSQQQPPQQSFQIQYVDELGRPIDVVDQFVNIDAPVVGRGGVNQIKENNSNGATNPNDDPQ